MLSYTFDSDKEMDEAETYELCKLLGLKSNVQIKDFLENKTEPHTFYEFFFNVLVGQNVVSSIDIDWRWTPHDLFWQIQSYFSDLTIEEIAAVDTYDEKTQNITSWRVVFKLNNVKKEVVVDFGRPSELLEALNLEKEAQLVEINFLEDRYSWLIVPAVFDEKRFAAITGCQQANKPTVVSFDMTAPRDDKIFFYPEIVRLLRDNKIYCVFCVNPHTNEIVKWAGRVLPGQTLHEGVATELKEMFKYEGAFDVGSVSFKDELADKQGKLIKRYSVWISLLDPLDTTVKPLGNNIVLYDVEAWEPVN